MRRWRALLMSRLARSRSPCHLTGGGGGGGSGSGSGSGSEGRPTGANAKLAAKLIPAWGQQLSEYPWVERARRTAGLVWLVESGHGELLLDLARGASVPVDVMFG